MTAPPEFDRMTGVQLVEAYNALAGLLNKPKRRAKFSDRAEGISRCKELQERVDAMVPAPTARPRKRASHDKVIRLEVNGNPRREGTHAHAHFEKMRGGITVGEYLSRFPRDQRPTAARWLANTISDGYAKLLG